MPTDLGPLAVDDAAPDAGFRHRRGFGIGGALASTWMALALAMAVAPGIFPVPALTERSRDALVADRFGPQPGHWLGVDSNGFDMAAKVVHGARASLLVGVGAMIVGLLLGGTLGLLAGYFRGRTDAVVSTVFDFMLAFPQLVLALTLVTVFATSAQSEEVAYGQRVAVVTLAIGVASVPVLGRIARAATLTWAQREFVVAARSGGATSLRIIVREILPNVAPTLLSVVLLGIGVVIVVEGGLALLGLGVPPSVDSPSWGNLIATLRSQLFLGRPWGVFAPSIAVFLTVLSLNVLG
ncbi:MAG TPA: ABC transporter permease, partial [Iamia sp.]|nr:ABC transporter permease [Iamia sp.]